METILNTQNYDLLKNPMFLGEHSLGIQRYDLIKYPKFRQLTIDQRNNFWTPEETALTKDRADYEEMTHVDRFVWETNIKYQTMQDSGLSRSIGEITKYITNNELEACCNVWSFFEDIHSESYTHILQNVVKDPHKF